MTTFIPYEKMTETSGVWDTKRIKSFKSKDKKDAWIVTEKIHGANFSFVVDNTGVRAAKRGAILEEGSEDEFFNCKTVIDTNKQHMIDLYNQIKNTLNCDSITVFGELFGGRYPHPDTPSCTQPVQQGVWYSPNIDWMAYDICVTISDTNRRYLPYGDCIELFKMFNIKYVPILFTGTFSLCSNYKLPFQSTIASNVGYPPLPGDNKAEGVVIKPFQNELLVPLVGKSKLTRAIIKLKCSSFSEWSSKEVVNKTTTSSDPDIIIKSMLNDNRVNSAISKCGRLSLKTLNSVEKYIISDIRDELSAMNISLTETDVNVEKQVSVFLKEGYSKKLKN